VDEELLELIQDHDQWPGVEPRRRVEHLGQARRQFVLVGRSKLFEQGLPNRFDGVKLGAFDVNAAVVLFGQPGPESGLQERSLAVARFAAQHAEAEIAGGDRLRTFGQIVLALEPGEERRVVFAIRQQSFDGAALRQIAARFLFWPSAPSGHHGGHEESADQQPEVERVTLGKLCDAEQFENLAEDDRIEGREEERVEQQKFGRPVLAAQDFDQPLDEFVRLLDGLFDGFCVGCFLHRGLSAEVTLGQNTRRQS